MNASDNTDAVFWVRAALFAATVFAWCAIGEQVLSANDESKNDNDRMS